MERLYRAEVDINLDNIRWNLLEMRRLIKPEQKLLAVIKADAYGHGAVPVAKAVDDIVDFYAVACVDEGIELRNGDITKPIMVLGYTDISEYEGAIKNDISMAMYDEDSIVSLSSVADALGMKAKIHVKIDTGMGRIGFACNEDTVQTVKRIKALSGIEVEGIFTHYAKADELDKTAALGQLEKFTWINEKIAEAGINIPYKHIANSAGIMEMENKGYDMVRSGIVTYGLYPSEEVDKKIAGLKPAMEFVSRVIHIKNVKAGTGIGYGWSFIADKDMKVATVSVGYADGYPRAQSNLGRVIINGVYAPIIGRVCMDQMMVDVSHIDDVKVRDKVVLIGTVGDKTISVEEVAAPANSFNYELVCNVGRRVPRVYFRDGKMQNVVNYLLY